MTDISPDLTARELQDRIDKVADDLAYRYDGTFTRRELLEPKAIAEGKVAKQKPELPFVCVHNAGRSQIAAALPRHLPNQRVNLRSAGSTPTGEINPVVKEVLDERSIPIPEAYPKPREDTVVRAADVIVTMGCGEPARTTRARARLGGRRPSRRLEAAGTRIVDDIQVRITALLHNLLDKD